MIYYFKDDFLGQTRTFIRILFGNNQLEQAWAELKLATHALPTSDYRVHGTQNNRLEFMVSKHKLDFKYLQRVPRY